MLSRFDSSSNGFQNVLLIINCNFRRYLHRMRRVFGIRQMLWDAKILPEMDLPAIVLQSNLYRSRVCQSQRIVMANSPGCYISRGSKNPPMATATKQVVVPVGSAAIR